MRIALSENSNREALEPAIERIQRNVRRCDRIITELLDYGRSPEPRFQRMRLERVVETALAAVPLPDGVTLVANPFGPGPTRYDCVLEDARPR